MSQNTSSAVMQQRSEPSDSLDFFPTPAWATRALCRWIEDNVGLLHELSCLEPACGQGHMARPLAEFFASVFASDVFDYGYGSVEDFLFPGNKEQVDWTATNPPFRLAEEFIQEGLRRSRIGVAMLVRTSFLEGIGRYQDLFSKFPPRAVLQFSERVPMFKGVVRDPAVPYWDEAAQKWRRASSATSYCWIIWTHAHLGHPDFHWLPPCRKALERAGDYDEVNHAS